MNFEPQNMLRLEIIPYMYILEKLDPFSIQMRQGIKVKSYMFSIVKAFDRNLMQLNQ